MALTPRQEAFAQAVVSNGGDKVKARETAGYSMAMSKAAQSVDGDNLYNHPKISLRIVELQTVKNKIAKEEFNIDAQYVLKRLHEIDNLDILDIVKPDLKSFRPLDEWPKSWRISISGLDMKRIITKGDEEEFETLIEKVKWPDKVKNLEMIGRHINVKAWDKEVEQVHTTNYIMPVPTADSADSWEEIAKKQQEAILNAN